jgi:poly(3-hydroxybutyrate) depolymerase
MGTTVSRRATVKSFLLGLWIALAVASAASAAVTTTPAQGWRRVDLAATGSYFFRYVPASLDTSRPAPVVLFFHGSGSKPFDYHGTVQDAAERAGCIVALPKSESSEGWGTGDDDQTIAETLRLLREETAIDPAHIAVSGHSAGGAYAYLLAYTTRSQYSAVFTWAVRYYPVSAVADPTYKAPIRMFYGTADPNYGGSYNTLKMQWNRLGVASEDDIRAGLGHSDMPADAMAAGFQFLVGKSYPLSAPSGVCTPTATALCLQGGRYRVEVTWRDFAGKTGVGSVVPGAAADSGLFWFFAPENWELMVKVLDACASSGHHWVFAAATTTVEYTLTVTDTTNGTAAVYRNPLGQTAVTVTDTAALGCP